MSKTNQSTLVQKIEDDELWRAVSSIARSAYNISGALSDEQWTLKNRFETGAFDVTNDVAEACGSLDPRDIKWSLGRARKDLFVLKNAFSLAFHIDQMPTEPEVMVSIDKAVKMVDERVDNLALSFKKWRDEMSFGSGAVI